MTPQQNRLDETVIQAVLMIGHKICWGFFSFFFFFFFAEK